MKEKMLCYCRAVDTLRPGPPTKGGPFFPFPKRCLKQGFACRRPPILHTSSCRRDLKGKILMGPGREEPGMWTS